MRVIEPVREDRRATPGRELALEAFGGPHRELAASRPPRRRERGLVGGVGGRQPRIAAGRALDGTRRGTGTVALARQPLERRCQRHRAQPERRAVRVPDAPPQHAVERLGRDLRSTAEHALDERVQRDDLAPEHAARACAGIALQRVALERRRHEQQRALPRLACAAKRSSRTPSLPERTGPTTSSSVIAPSHG